MPETESVWDYPRPPLLQSCDDQIRIIHNDTLIAESQQTLRLLETSHPPVYYISPADIQMQLLTPNQGRRTVCEWKGQASYYDLALQNERIDRVAWCYHAPLSSYSQLKDYLAFYPSKLAVCLVNGEQVTAQDGDFYGGWITSKITGPFKGPPGTMGW